MIENQFVYTVPPAGGCKLIFNPPFRGGANVEKSTPCIN